MHLTVDRFVLANGLEVWHKERPDTGTVSLILLVRAGARYETAEDNGISHFLEHMLFDGSERWDEYEVKEVIRRRGGYYNALTDYEYTAYEAHLLSADFELALDWLTEIVFHATFPPEKVSQEREVLIQEKGGRSSRFLQLLESWGFGYDLGLAVRQHLFPRSSLGLRIAGEDESLARIDREKLVAYYQRYYRPNNMALIIAGDVSAARAREAVEHYLVPLEAGPVPPKPPVPAAAGRGIRVLLTGPNLSDRAALRRGARTVCAGDADVPALEVLGEVLSNRLTDEIRVRQGLVYSVAAYNVALSDVGYFAIRTESDGAKMADIQATIEHHLERLRSERVPDEELHEAKASLNGQFALTTQSNVSLAWLCAGYAVWCRIDTCVPDYCAHIQQVSADDVLRVAQRYFVPDNSYHGLYRPAFTFKTGALGLAASLALVMGMVLWQRGQKGTFAT